MGRLKFVLDKIFTNFKSPLKHASWAYYCVNSPKQQLAGRHVAPLGHIILIPSQPHFALKSFMPRA